MSGYGILGYICVITLFQIGAQEISTPSIVNGKITIDKAGNYYVINHLKITEKNDEIPLLEITHSDVMIDFQNFTIEGALAKNRNIGIKIAPHISNVVIKNGAIKNCSGSGLVLGESCFNVSINNFLFLNMLSPAVSIDNGGVISFENVKVLSIRAETDSAKYVQGKFNTVGMYLFETVHKIENDCLVKNMTINHLYQNGDENICAAVVAQNIGNLNFEQMLITGFRGVQVYGFYFDRIYASRMLNITIDRIIAHDDSTSHVVGMCFDRCSDCLVKDSLIYGCRSDNSLIGIEWTGSSFEPPYVQHLTIEDVRISQNYGKHTVFGIKGQNGKHNLIKHCQIISNRNQIEEYLDTDIAAGISIYDFEEVSQITNSDVCLQFGLGRVFGIVLGLDSTYGYYPLMTIIDNNKLFNNVSVFSCYGFRDYSVPGGFYPSATVLTNNVAIGQGPVFKLGTSSVSDDERFMNYYSYDIKQNPVGIVDELPVTDLNSSARPVGNALNRSYVSLDLIPFLTDAKKRLAFIQRHALG